MDSQAVLIVHMQPFFLRDITHERLEEVVSAQRQVLRECASADIPVFVLESEHYGSTIESLQRLVRRVPRSFRIKDNGVNIFEDASLHQELARHKTKVLLLMGVCTSFCIHNVSIAALARGYAVMVPPNLIADSDAASVRRRRPTIS